MSNGMDWRRVYQDKRAEAHGRQAHDVGSTEEDMGERLERKRFAYPNTSHKRTRVRNQFVANCQVCRGQMWPGQGVAIRIKTGWMLLCDKHSRHITL